MSKKRSIVELTSEERSELAQLVKTSKRVARHRRTRAAILLKVDEGEHGPAWTDAKTAEALDVGLNTVIATRKQLVFEGLDRAVNRKRRVTLPRARIFDETSERQLLVVAASEAPKGQARWTLHLLADAVVRLDIVDAVSHETVRQVLKKTTSSLTAKSRG